MINTTENMATIGELPEMIEAAPKAPEKAPKAPKVPKEPKVPKAVARGGNELQSRIARDLRKGAESLNDSAVMAAIDKSLELVDFEYVADIKETTPLFLSVNGQSIAVKPNTPVQIPRCFKEVYDASRASALREYENSQQYIS